MTAWLLEVQNAIVGSWRLAIRDIGGYDDFNQTEAGFWRSFSAVIIVAPLFLYATDLQIGMESAEPGSDSPSSGLNAAFVSLVVQWAAWPLVMMVIARYAGLAGKYSRYIIAYNWSSILVMAVQIAPIYLFAQGGNLAEFGSLMFLAALALVIYYRWYIAFTALETTGSIASALVLADLVISIGIARLIG